MKEKIDYDSIQNLSKQERRAAIINAGLIDDRRFLLPAKPELRERIHLLRQAIESFKQLHPEVVSFGLFGSFTKGYATLESNNATEQTIQRRADLYPQTLRDARLVFLKENIESEKHEGQANKAA